MGWLDDAVVYQVYLRSFADSDGDGLGDLPGLAARLDHIAGLGVDGVWISPCFASPQADHGYDVADYYRVDPMFGTNADLEDLVARAHERDLRILLDLVPNHCSTEHAWFREALAAGPGSPERARFHFAPGRGEAPPNNWESVFGGPAWTRAAEHGAPDGEWYLHLFDSGQPDVNWANPEVGDMFEDVLRFWFARGVDGFRVDVAHGLVKVEGLPDWPAAGEGSMPMWNQEGVHPIYRRWRRVANEYGADFVGEVWTAPPADLARYADPDELGQVFAFDLLPQAWDATLMREAIEPGLALPGVAWALANHDVHRTATRYGQAQVIARPDPHDMLGAARRTGPVDVPLGRTRAVAGTMMMLALPGAAYLYQGDELALTEVLDLPDAVRSDPMWIRTGGAQLGRDGCRVPMPWSERAPAFGFSASARTWLPQPPEYGPMSVAVQEADPAAPLHTVRAAVAARGLFTGPLEWLEAPDGVLAFRRGDGVCVLNTSAAAVPIPPAWGTPRLASTPCENGAAAPDSCVWLS